MISRPRALLFDWDNTLVDSWPTIHEALNTTLTAMGHAPWTLEESKARIRLSLRDSFPLLFRDRWEEARRIYMDAFLAVHLERLTALPGAAALLEHLSRAPFYLGIVSNKTGPVLRREADRLGWTRYFGRLVGATDAALDKPDAAPVHMALEGSGIAAGADVWFVGDTEIDMLCARNAGCVPVFVGPAAPDEGGLVEHQPALSFCDINALFVHLQAL